MSRLELTNMSPDLMQTIERLKERYREKTATRAVKRVVEQHFSLLDRIEDFQNIVNSLRSELRWYESKFDQLKRAKQMENEIFSMMDTLDTSR